MSDENNRILGDFEMSLSSSEHAQEEQIQKKWDLYTPGKRRGDMGDGDALLATSMKFSQPRNAKLASAVTSYLKTKGKA